MMDVDEDGGEKMAEEGAQRGQTMLTEFFPTCFRSPQSKSNTPSKHTTAYCKQASVVGGAAVCGSVPRSLSTELRVPSKRSFPEPSAHVSLSERIQRARAVVELALEDVCCNKTISNRRSMGIALCRGVSTPADAQVAVNDAGNPWRHASCFAEAADLTQLDPASAIEAVEAAARAFSKVILSSSMQCLALLYSFPFPGVSNRSTLALASLHNCTRIVCRVLVAEVEPVFASC